MFSLAVFRSFGLRLGLSHFGAAFLLAAGHLLAAETKESSGLERQQRQRVPAESPAVPVKRQGTANPSIEGAATIITAQKRLLLDSQGKEATFWGDVKVLDPRFSLACEKLTIYLRDATGLAGSLENKEPKEGGNGKEKREPDADGALEKAVAEGDVVIFQEKTNDNGEVERSVGRARKAVFDTKTGNITLSGWPQVEQKQNTIVALEEGTVILLNRKGTLEVLGHSKSVLRNTKSEHAR